jgi:GNAT superfamily N-acetyltransferase
MKHILYKRHPIAPPWHERIVLDDRRELLMRPIDPADAPCLREGFALLTPDEVRMRYQHPMKSLSEDYVQRLTHPRKGREFVLVLAEPLPPGEALIGAVARLSQTDGSRDAEFAILVSHFIAGRGLGLLLMKKLVQRARRCGLESIRGDVLEDNTAMLHLAEQLGFVRESGPEAGLVRVRLTLAVREETLHQARELAH